MEKLMYLLWKNDSDSRADFSKRLLNDAGAKLCADNTLGVQINVADDAIVPAEHMLIENNKPRYHGVASVWVESYLQRDKIETILREHCYRIAGYLVSESCPMPNTTQQATLGERTPGFSQVVCLSRPARLSTEEWMTIWHGSHTQIAIDTQSTFMYRQNVVVRPLTYGAAPIDAIIEECFPEAAMTSWEAFYEAEGDPEKFQKNQGAMIESCVRFIDMDKIDAVQTSEYNLSTFRR